MVVNAQSSHTVTLHLVQLGDLSIIHFVESVISTSQLTVTGDVFVVVPTDIFQAK